MIPILCVDDDAGLLEAMRAFLEADGGFEVRTCLSAEEALDRLAAGPFDAVISGHRMPGMDGLRFLKALREKDPEMPFILFTGGGDEDVAVGALNSGADFYLRKGDDPAARFAELRSAVQQLATRRAGMKALAELQERFRDLVENTNDVPYIIDPGGMIVYISPSIRRYGYDAAAVMGRPVLDFIVPEDRFDIHARLRDVSRGMTDPLVFRIRSPSGDVFWMRGSGRPIITGGVFAGVRGVLTDFTREKELEDELRAGEARFRGIFDNAPMGIFHSTRDGELLDANPAFARIFGYDSQEEMIAAVNGGGGMLSLYHEPERRDLMIRETSEAKDWKTFDNVWRKKDGSTFLGTFTFRVYYNPGGRQELEGFVVDVTESRKAQARIAASERRYHNVFDSASDALIVTDRQTGRILDANRAAQALYRYSPGEFRTLRYPDLAAPPPDGESADAPGGFAPSTYHRKSDNTVFPVEVTESTYPQKNREIRIASVRDATGRKEAEARILASRRMYIVLSRVGEAIVRVRDLETLLSEICRIAVQYGQFRMVWVGLVDKEKRIVSPVAHAGFEDGYLSRLRVPLDPTPEGCGPTGSAFRTGKPVVTDDIATDPRMEPWREEALRRGYHSSAAFPFTLHGEVVGVISLYAEKPGFFTATEAALLSEIAGDVSFALGLLDEQARRAQAEKALAGSEEHARFLATLLEMSSQPFFVGYEDGRFGVTNPAFCGMLGYTEAEIRNLSWKDLTPPEFAGAEKDELVGLVATGIPRRYEKEFVRKDGSRVPVAVVAHRSVDSGGNLRFFSSFVTDITEQKKALSASREERKEWETIFSAIGNPAMVLDPDAGIIKVNDAILEKTGKTREELRGMKCWQVMHGPELSGPPADCPFARVMESGMAGNAEVHLSSGMYLVTCTPVRDSDGKISRVIHIATDITALKRAEQALADSEARYRTIFATSTDAIVLMDDAAIADCNPAMERLCGLPRDLILGRDLPDFSPPVQPDGMESAAACRGYRKAAREWGTQFFPWQFRNNDGRLVDTDVSLTSVTLGGEQRLIAIVRDVTARRHAEAQIEKSEEMLRLITDTVSDMVWLTDTSLMPVYISPSASRLRGYSLDELQNLALSDRLTPESCAIMLEVRDALVAGGGSQKPGAAEPVTVELEFCRKDGTTFWSENAFTLIRDDDGRPYRILSVGRDITERKQLENQARRLASFPELNPEPVIEISLEKEILFANPACRKLLEDLRMPGNPAAFLPPDIDEVIDQLLSDRSGTISRDVAVGDAIFAEALTLSPGGIAVRVYAHDITDRLQEAGAIMRANRKLHLLTGITRHDIRNRLTAVLGYIDLARSSTGDPTLQEYLTRSETAAVAIRHQIEFTKEYETLGSSAPVWHPVETVVGDAKKQVDLDDVVLECDVSGVRIYADPMFTRIIVHLIDNALRHGGPDISRIRFSGSVTPDGYVLVCEDNGAGIPKKDKASIFRRVIKQDTRIGLYLMREILALTMITIRETGEPGKGARFEIVVPQGAYRIMPEE